MFVLAQITKVNLLTLPRAVLSLAIASQADQNGVVLKMSEFLALLAIESHRTAAQHIEVAGSKRNTSQTFANIVAVDLAWKKTENK